MYKIISILFFVGLLSSPLPAQLKIGYIDSDTIMDNLPDVQDARQKLDAMIRDCKVRTPYLNGAGYYIEGIDLWIRRK